MDTAIRFTVRGEPQGKGRPRVVRNGAFSRTYTPDKTVAYENLVKVEYQRQCGKAFIKEGYVAMRLTAYYAIPKSASKRRRAQMEAGTIMPIKKPDCDNVIKVICDALNGLAYHDDAQVVDARVVKLYGDTPRVEVEIEELEG